MDGAHRITALQRLQKDRTIPEIQESFMIQVKVVSVDVLMIQRTLHAAAENNSVENVFAKKTFAPIYKSCIKFSRTRATLFGGATPIKAAQNPGIATEQHSVFKQRASSPLMP
jgi:hypothetical protein